MKRTIAQLVDAALNRYAPIVHARSAAAFTTADTTDGADMLADVEAHFDSLPPWQRHDDGDWPDELWAAMQRHPVGKLRPNETADDYVRAGRHLFPVPDQPADAGALPGVDGSQTPAGAEAVDLPPSTADATASATGAGGFPTEADIKVAIGRVLRDCGAPWPTTTAGILARELLHHFEFRHK